MFILLEHVQCVLHFTFCITLGAVAAMTLRNCGDVECELTLEERVCVCATDLNRSEFIQWCEVCDLFIYTVRIVFCCGLGCTFIGYCEFFLITHGLSLLLLLVYHATIIALL